MDIRNPSSLHKPRSGQTPRHLVGSTKLLASLLIIAVIIITVLGLFLTFNLKDDTSLEVSFPLVISDDLGRNISIPHEPRRIVSLIPSATELVFAVGAGDRVVGVTRFDDYPPELVSRVENGTVLSVGGGVDPSIEAIIELDPDIILIGGAGHAGSKAIVRLEKLGFIIISIRPDNIDGILKNLELLGRITGNVEQSERVVQSMQETLDFVESKTKDAPKLRVYIENWHDPIFSVGRGTLQHELIERAGGINIFSDIEGSRQVNIEAVIAKNPDIIISFNNQIGLDEIKGRPGWGVINAIRDDKIYQLSVKAASPNPRIATSLEQVARIIHPELFENQTEANSIRLVASIEAWVHKH